MSKLELLNEILANLKEVTEYGTKLIQAAVARANELAQIDCPDRKALELAIWSDKQQITKETRKKLHLLIGEYL